MSKTLRQYSVKILQGSVSLYVPEATAEVKITKSPVNTPSPDSGGRTYQLGSNIKAEFVLMGNSNVDYATLYNTLIANEKLDVIFEDENDSDLDLQFLQVALIVDPVIDGSGKYEGIKCSFTRVLSKAKVLALFNAPTVLFIRGNIATAGGVAESGVLISYENGGIYQYTGTDENGDYEAVVPYGYVGRITPTKGGKSFAPAYRDYDSITANQLDQDYVAS